jgi:hypothetical protein
MTIVISQRVYADLLAANVDVTNRGLRHGAYRQFTYWREGKMGFGKRKVIPACCVWRIRDEFPSQHQVYTGFKEARIV